MEKKFFLLIFVVILNFGKSLQCSSSSPPPPPPPPVEPQKPPPTNWTEVIESTHYLKFLKNFESVSRVHLFDKDFFQYLKCNGSFIEEIGKVLHGLCSYCVEMQPEKYHVYWRCMKGCFTEMKTGNCHRQYKEFIREKVEYIDVFVHHLSGGHLKD